MVVGGRRTLRATGHGDMVGTVYNGQGVQVSVEMSNVLIAPVLGRCLFSPSVTSRVGIYAMYEASALKLLNIDCGGGDEVNTSGATWHIQLRHINAADPKEVRGKGVGVAYKGEVPNCSACHAHKSTRQLRSKETESRATKRLDRVLTDIKGPFFPSQFEGYRFALIMFIDDFSRLEVVNIMSKSPSLQKLQDFKGDVADMNQITITALRSDRGGEFTGAFFREY